ncbi:hypothetical protein [Mesorhizobium sp. LNJC391B00]|uniref:hypothetical protein n=1 Tax=Mesorhizobium sp. LNJC391B00 TaxID=1287273 RepID=UPI0003CE4251|nr:hypothetical protein [Mesorhizobium sp. LNJC391B00]ESY17735.1 hypothetical protein X749_30495 [Mesorhizobium sp. LNJC391B00]
MRNLDSDAFAAFVAVAETGSLPRPLSASVEPKPPSVWQSAGGKSVSICDCSIEATAG